VYESKFGRKRFLLQPYRKRLQDVTHSVRPLSYSPCCIVIRECFQCSLHVVTTCSRFSRGMCFDYFAGLFGAAVFLVLNLVNVIPFTPLVKCELSYSLCACPVSCTCLVKSEMSERHLFLGLQFVTHKEQAAATTNLSHKCTLYWSGYPRAGPDFQRVVYS